MHGSGREIAYGLCLTSSCSCYPDDQNEAQEEEEVHPKSLDMDMNPYLPDF